MRIKLYDFCLKYEKENLLDEWDTEKNNPKTPHDVTYGSKEKVWWRCPKGHEWQAAVYSRTGIETNCPYCAGKKVMKGQNDLASQYPEIAAQWHPIKNGLATPDMIYVRAHRSAWWICEKGHEWRATVKSRTAGANCPACAGRILLHGRNDLAAMYPDLAREWHPQKNNGLQPCDVSPRSVKRVWWRCEKSHEWQAKITARVAGSGCPVCTGRKIVPGENDLATMIPDVAAEWLQEKNGRLTPEMLAPYSNRKVWWRCKEGHVYQASVGARSTSNSGCPYCANRKVLRGFNDLATTAPEIAAQWHPSLNGNLTPADLTKGSAKRIWWLCPEGHVWKAKVYSRTSSQKCGCPVCAKRVKTKYRAS